MLNQAFNLSSFAEQMLVHENAMVKIDDDIPLDRAALVGCGVMTGVGAVFNAAKVEPGATVAVIGCGGVGLSAVNGAALAGRRADHRDRHRGVEARTGAARWAPPTRSTRRNVDAVGAVKDMTGGGVHYSFEAIGTKTTAEQAFAHAAAGRHRDDHRHGPVRHEDRAARLRFPARPQDPGHLDGRQPLPGGHAAAAGLCGSRAG